MSVVVAVPIIAISTTGIDVPVAAVPVAAVQVPILNAATPVLAVAAGTGVMRVSILFFLFFYSEVCNSRHCGRYGASCGGLSLGELRPGVGYIQGVEHGVVVCGTSCPHMTVS